MQVFGLMVVRNEADILAINIHHHLNEGIDQFLVVDNGSTDGTPQVLEELSRSGRLEWTHDAGPYRQSEITTELACEAFRRGADWVVPIDADEFWYAPERGLRAILESSSAGALQVEVLNFIQQRDQGESTPEALASMTCRAPLPVGPLEQVRELVESRQFAYVEMVYSPKFVSRPSADIQIAMGNHGVNGAQGPLEPTSEILCLHALVRSRSVLEAKVEQGARVEELGLGPEQGWHVRRWRRLAAEGGLEKEWRANSFAGDTLDVYGVPHRVVFDPTLRDVVGRWLPGLASAPADDERPALLKTIHEQLHAHVRDTRRHVDHLERQRAERDRIIRGLQAELHSKVAERDRLIAELQDQLAGQDRLIRAVNGELQQKVGESNRIIASLHQELQDKVGERDLLIRELQAELQTKVGELDGLIAELQAELQTKVGERDRLIAELQAKLAEQDGLITSLSAELHDKVGECNRVIAGLQEELHAKVGDRDRMIATLNGRVDEQDRALTELRRALDSIRSSRWWPLIRRLLKTGPGGNP